MEKQEMEPQRGGDAKTPGRRPINAWLLVAVIAVVFFFLFYNHDHQRSKISYGFFLNQIENENVATVEFGERSARGTFKTRPDAPPVYENGKWVAQEGEDEKPKKLLEHFIVYLPTDENIIQPLVEQVEAYGGQASIDPPDNTQAILFTLILLSPFILILILWISYRRTRDQLMGGGFLGGFSKSPAKRFEATDQQTTFNDVAGLEGVKADLQEIVEFLKSPEKFRKLGGRVPKGVLLNGPPGTGKTLLARAVAGEAGVPFFSVSGSEFIQMFVGVGASRVRDLFKTAKDQAPAIIFIDEIDAVGRQRGAGLGGGHDEREQTLNQILSEMDGFTGNDSVIVMAATNRPDVLDPALLRPGRFDRQTTVNRPTYKGRIEILKVHVRDVPLAEDVDLERVASGTVGLTGADLRNMVNEAALWAARNDKSKVEMDDFEYARDKILMGAKREEVLQDSEKEKTAYHEAGHTLAAWYLDGANRVHKVTIIPRGRALGVTQIVPTEDRLSISEHELRHQLIVLLGGRAAEHIVYGETCVGAENDLERATGIARRMVTHWGMSQRLGPVSYKTADDDPFLGRELHQQKQFSEHTQEIIDEEVARILHKAADECEKLLKEKRDELERVTQALVEREELSETELTEMIGPSVHAIKTQKAEEEGKDDQRKPETVVAPESASEHAPGSVVESPNNAASDS